MSEQNNFEDLKQLLKLKQHEVPPPGYFNNFSSDVIARIRAGEASAEQSFTERLVEQSPWLANLLSIFEAKPGVIGGLATALCVLLLVGVVLADRPDSAPATTATAMVNGQPAADAADAATLASTTTLLPAGENAGISVSTNPVASFQPVATLFGQPQNPLFQNASFVPGQ